MIAFDGFGGRAAKETHLLYEGTNHSGRGKRCAAPRRPRCKAIDVAPTARWFQAVEQLEERADHVHSGCAGADPTPVVREPRGAVRPDRPDGDDAGDRRRVRRPARAVVPCGRDDHDSVLLGAQHRSAEHRRPLPHVSSEREVQEGRWVLAQRDLVDRLDNR